MMEDRGYKIIRVEKDDIETLRHRWHELECGPDMTFFQRYEWYSMIAKYTPVAKGIDCGYYVVEKDGKAVMIAPLWIITRRIGIVNKPGVYLMGRKRYTDYLNFIYREMDPQGAMCLFEHIKSRYGNLTWHFEYLKESALLKFLQENAQRGIFSLDTTHSSTYAILHLPATKEDYLQSLASKMKQNIRRAHNRAKTDGVNFIITLDDQEETVRKRCVELREEWLEKKVQRDKKGVSWKGKIYMKLRWLLYERFLIRFPTYSPITDCPTTRLLTIKDANTGDIAAFFLYGLDYEQRSVALICTGVNQAYTNYSPGITCLKEFIDDCISQGHYLTFDFSRGPEPYKFWMGAKRWEVKDYTVKMR